jgi:hypothetical protein
MLVKETQSMNQMSLNTAILTFAFTGVLAPHKHEREAPPPFAKPTTKKK